LALVRSRSFRPRGMFRGVRRAQRLEWNVTAATMTAGPDSYVGTAIIGTSFLQTMTRPTLTRIHGEVVVYSSSVLSSDLNYAFMGMQLLPSSVVDMADAEDPFSFGMSNRWLWHHTAPLVGSPVTDTIGSVIAASRIVIDNRSKRRISESDQLWFLLANAAGPGSPISNISCSVSLRLLFRETGG